MASATEKEMTEFEQTFQKIEVCRIKLERLQKDITEAIQEYQDLESILQVIMGVVWFMNQKN